MADGVLLIPGFFGFASFGQGAAQISYFDHVEQAIQGARPDLKGWVDVSRPPPTGSLQSRVQNLHDTILAAFMKGLGPDGRVPDRLHLIGHSTGGVDARLLVNSRYALTTDQRGTFLPKLGAVVTLSAPLYGTPIADRLAGPFQLSLPILYLLSIAVKAREVAVQAGWPEPAIGQVLALLSTRTVPNAAALQLLLHLDAKTAGDIARFLTQIVTSNALINDLQPAQMAALNASIAGGDTRPLQHFVSVAPAPSIPIPSLFHPLTSLAFHELYALLYTATASATFQPATFPNGPWIRPSDEALAQAAPETNDGVVPSTSQTLAGNATAIVEGDHLDVVGHFNSQRFPGTTVFESDAGFDDDRFARLWRTIALGLG